MSSLKNKMYDFEVTPPENSWDKIAMSLDEAESGRTYPNKLYELEIAPPPDAWNKISQALEEQAQPVMTKQKPKLRTLLRYAAAAILIGLIAFGIFSMLDNRNTQNGEEIARIPLRPDTSMETSPPKDHNDGNMDLAKKNQEEEDNTALELSKKMVARLDPPVKAATPINDVSIQRPPFSNSRYDESELNQTIYAYEDHVPDISDRYVMLLTPDGNIIRMAKKWSDLLCCVSGEQQDEECKDQLRKWQEKMATSVLAPTPGNFMDILGLINSRDETRGL